MASNTADLSESEAQLMMSRLMDGELSPQDAERLHTFLEGNPDAIDWMESNQILSESAQSTAPVNPPSMWEEIRAAIKEETEIENTSPKLIRFPLLLPLLGAAAAVALVASLIWTNLPKSSSEMTERYAASQSVVEYIETDIPDASPVVYTDEISGWTVVWVAEMEPIADEAG